MQRARTAEVIINYNGRDITADLAGSLIDLTYTDNPSGQLDDLRITLEDRENKWQGSWSPNEGDKITASIRTINWNGPNEFKTLPLGSFEVDSGGLSGPPDTIQIQALSIPTGTGVRREARTKAWEKLSLRAIAKDIADRAKLTLLYESPDNPIYERLDQTEQSDFPFLLGQCKKEGISLKVSSNKLVLFDESVYERRAAVATLKRGEDAVKSYSFGWSITDSAYRACQLAYKPPKSKTTTKVTYTPPNAPKIGPLLKINEVVKSAAEALRTARLRLREKNKNFGRASLQLAGDVRMSTGLTINLSGWGRYDGKYIIEKATHAVGGGGYVTDIEIRKVLGW